ncbi:hypothetical protein MKX03_035857, partial [Papaver bracteatum]
RRWTTERLTPAIAALGLLLPSEGDGLSHGYYLTTNKDIKLGHVTVLEETTSKISGMYTMSAYANRWHKVLQGKLGRNSLFSCRGTMTSANQRVTLFEYQDGVIELEPAVGISNDGWSFVFDRGKAARTSFDIMKLNISGLLPFTISKATSFVFDRGKSVGCYTRVHENENEEKCARSY